MNTGEKLRLAVQLEKLGVDKKLANEIEDAVKKKIKPKEVMIQGDLNIEVYQGEGIDVIKDALKKNLNDNITINYAGAGIYRVIVKAKNYKQAEDILDKYVDATVKIVEDKEGVVKFDRKEK